MAKGSLTARGTSRAGAKAEHSEPTARIRCGRRLTDKSYSGDNRLVSPKSSYRRRSSAPRCRLILSWGWRKHTFSPNWKRLGNKQAQNGEGLFMWHAEFPAGPRCDIITHMKANAVGKIHNEVDRAYLAGLIDGDGAIMAIIEKHSEKKFGFRVRLEIKITQKEEKILLILQKKYQIGRVVANRATYDWVIRDQSDIQTILNFISPYSLAKQPQIKLAGQILNMNVQTRTDLICVARLADALSRFNVRSKNRRKNYASMI